MHAPRPARPVDRTASLNIHPAYQQQQRPLLAELLRPPPAYHSTPDLMHGASSLALPQHLLSDQSQRLDQSLSDLALGSSSSCEHLPVTFSLVQEAPYYHPAPARLGPYDSPPQYFYTGGGEEQSADPVYQNLLPKQEQQQVENPYENLPPRGTYHSGSVEEGEASRVTQQSSLDNSIPPPPSPIAPTDSFETTPSVSSHGSVSRDDNITINSSREVTPDLQSMSSLLQATVSEDSSATEVTGGRAGTGLSLEAINSRDGSQPDRHSPNGDVSHEPIKYRVSCLKVLLG